MSAATARRPNYGSTIASTTQQPKYPTPLSSTTGTSTGSVRSRPPPYIPSRTAGDSWSLQRDGERTVIVIEDTPPPTSGASNNKHATSYNQNNYPSGTAPNSKRIKVNGTAASANGNPAYADPNLQMPTSTGFQVNNLALAGPSRYSELAAGHAPSPSINAAKKVATQKRKYNQVFDPANTSHAGYGSAKEKQAIPCDDKDGHYVIRPDDELGDTRRYKIIRLLGQGTFGKVVECWDRDAKTSVAVKVIRAIPKYRDASKVEIKVLNLLRDRDPSNYNKCIHLLDCFDHRNHICIVTKLLSCSVFDFLKDNNYLPFPAAHIQSFAKQLLTSVAFLHDLRLVHTDLKPENILLVDSEYVSIPQRPTKNAPLVKMKHILKNCSIHLIDFGSATFEEEYHANVVSTRHYRAPEIILGLGWSYPCDVWSIGCILVEFFTGEALFQTHENLEHLAMMEVVFGRAPEGKWGRSAMRAKPEFFQPNSTKIAYPTAATTRQSKKYVRAMKPLETLIPPTNIVTSRFLDLLNHLLKWNPDDRYTVREALKHPFFSLKIDDDEILLASQMR